MRNILVEITCKNCLYHTHIKSHTLVQADWELALKKRVLNQTMFRYQCPRCNEMIGFRHNFLYRDKQHKFHVYMSEEEKDLGELKKQHIDACIRYVQTPTQLSETIRILEDGLDDRIIMILKHMLHKKYPLVETISYYDIDQDSDTLWFHFYEQGKRDIKGIEMKIYDQFKEQYTLQFKRHEAYKIDETWVQKCLSNS